MFVLKNTHRIIYNKDTTSHLNIMIYGKHWPYFELGDGMQITVYYYEGPNVEKR